MGKYTHFIDDFREAFEDLEQQLGIEFNEDQLYALRWHDFDRFIDYIKSRLPRDDTEP